MKILQTKPSVKNMIIDFYDLNFTFIKNRDDKEIVNDKNVINENDYIKFNDFITPNHYFGIKNDNVMLR